MDLQKQFYRYAVVGGLAFVVDAGSLYILTEYLQLYVLTSAAAAFSLGLLINYGLSVAWVFDVRVYDRRGIEFFLFAVIGVIGLGLNEGFIWFFIEKAGYYYLIAKCLSAGLVFCWNFFARKFLLFQRTQGKLQCRKVF
jgi:putative flippase GtrA